MARVATPLPAAREAAEPSADGARAPPPPPSQSPRPAAVRWDDDEEDDDESEAVRIMTLELTPSGDAIVCHQPHDDGASLARAPMGGSAAARSGPAGGAAARPDAAQPSPARPPGGGGIIAV